MRKIILFVIISFFMFHLSAQVITNYTTSDGLLDNFVECIDVDVNDNIWFGTALGAQGFNTSVFSWETYNLAGHFLEWLQKILKKLN